jgi:hypothetical protein
MRRTGAVCAALAVLVAGCGGGNERQDANEAAGDYRLEVTESEFPTEQRIAQRTTFKVAVRNADTKVVPNVAVTVKTENPGRPGDATVAFGRRVDDPALADPNRPIWIMDREPTGAGVAHTNTWALGRLKPGETRTFEWRLTAVQAGDYTIGYEVFPGLDGKARLASDAKKTKGSFSVTIDDSPAEARIGEDGVTVVRSTSQPGD